MEDKEVSNADLFALIKEIKNGNEGLRIDIRRDNELLKNEVKNEISSLARKVEEVKLESMRKEERDKKMMKNMNDRMTRIEKEITKIDEEKRKKI